MLRTPAQAFIKLNSVRTQPMRLKVGRARRGVLTRYNNAVGIKKARADRDAHALHVGVVINLAKQIRTALVGTHCHVFNATGS
jgi:hypothetical protein